MVGTNKGLSRNLKYLRIRHDMRDMQMDDFFQLQRGTWGLLEHGVAPTNTLLVRIADLFKISYNDLVNEDISDDDAYYKRVCDYRIDPFEKP